MIRVTNTRGLTLVELLVVVAILGLMAGVVGLGWSASPHHAEESQVTVARQRAIQSGIPTRFQIFLGGETVTLVALPDGSIIGTGGLPIDPLTGAPAASPDGAR